MMPVILTSCEIINPEEEIPSYITINAIDLKVSNPTLQGSASHKITDAWVYLNEDLIGTFELPATFPVLAAGNQRFRVNAGIKNNGISATRTAYPFYAPFETTVDLTRKDIITVNPSVTYYDGMTFAWIEDFEDAGITIDSASSSSVAVKRTTEDSETLEGNASGVISLSTTNSYFKGTSNEEFTLPKSGRHVYLELDYNTEVRLEIGIIPKNGTEIPILTLRPTRNDDGQMYWNKIYIELTEQVSYFTSASEFKIVFTASAAGSYKIYLDNIKLVHS